MYARERGRSLWILIGVLTIKIIKQVHTCCWWCWRRRRWWIWRIRVWNGKPLIASYLAIFLYCTCVLWCTTRKGTKFKGMYVMYPMGMRSIIITCNLLARFMHVCRRHPICRLPRRPCWDKERWRIPHKMTAFSAMDDDMGHQGQHGIMGQSSKEVLYTTKSDVDIHHCCVICERSFLYPSWQSQHLNPRVIISQLHFSLY